MIILAVPSLEPSGLSQSSCTSPEQQRNSSEEFLGGKAVNEAGAECFHEGFVGRDVWRHCWSPI